MAIHGLTATYQPFSFDDYIKPALLLQERHDKMQEELASKYDDVSAWKEYVDPNSTAGKTLTQYEQALDQAAQKFSAEGLKGISRDTLFNLKRMYNSQIAPIKGAVTNYAKLQAGIAAARAKDPTLMVSDMPTIDDLMANPNASPTYLSGSVLEKEGYNMAVNMPRPLIGNQEAITSAVGDIAAKYGNGSPEAVQHIMRGVSSGLTKQAKDIENEQIKLAQRIQLKQTRSGSRRGGSTIKTGDSDNKTTTETYNPTKGTGYYAADGTEYTNLENEKMWRRQSSGDETVRIDDLSLGEKIAALRFAGVEVTDEQTLSEASINKLIEENRWKLQEYTYKRTSFDRLTEDDETSLTGKTKRGKGSDLQRKALEIKARSGNQAKRTIPKSSAKRSTQTQSEQNNSNQTQDTQGANPEENYDNENPLG